MFNPININFHDTKALVIGDSPFAVSCTKQLLYYGCNVRIAAKKLPGELNNLRRVTLDTTDQSLIKVHNEKFVVVDTDDHELNLHLAHRYSVLNRCLIITSEPINQSNASLPEIDPKEIDDYLDRYLRRSEFRESLYEQKKKELFDLPYFKVTEQPEENSSLNMLDKNQIIVGVPSEESVLETEKIVSLWRESLPGIDFKIVVFEKINKNRDWRIYLEEKEFVTGLNSPINLAYDALVNDKVDIAILDACTLPTTIPEALKLTGGFIPRKDNRIFVIAPKEDASNFPNYLLNKNMLYFDSWGAEQEVRDLICLINPIPVWDGDVDSNILYDKDYTKIKQLINENPGQPFFISKFALDENGIDEDYLDSIGYSAKELPFSPRLLIGLTVGLIRSDQKGDQVRELLEPVIDKGLETEAVFEHYYYKRLQEIYGSSFSSGFSGGFVNKDNQTRFHGYADTPLGKPYTRNYPYRDNSEEAINDMLEFLENAIDLSGREDNYYS